MARSTRAFRMANQLQKVCCLHRGLGLLALLLGAALGCAPVGQATPAPKGRVPNRGRSNGARGITDKS